MSSTSAQDYISFILGKIFVLGQHLFVDEVNHLPLYRTVPEPCSLLQVMNPPDIDRGIFFPERSACERYVPAMIALGDVYLMHKLDPEKAEEHQLHSLFLDFSSKAVVVELLKQFFNLSHHP
eukprot:scaffold57845_cov82-Cyclotella_meneghiniana.AAC.3